MNSYETIKLEQSDDRRIATISIDRPKTKNSLNSQFWKEFDEVLKDFEADHECRVIILKGEGDGFSSGHDLSSPGSDSSDREYNVFYDHQDLNKQRLVNAKIEMQQITDVMMYFWNVSKVTIAQIHGFALAGGCELSMMADLVVAADDARIGHPGNRGIGNARNGNLWPLVLGMRKAKELYYTGDTITGKEAAECEMINYAWRMEELEEKTLALASKIANISSDHLASLKMTMNRFYENMGIYSSVRSATDLDALIQTSESACQFRARLLQDGPKAAFEWRENLYGD